MHVVKTIALISCAVSAQLICAFVFTNANIRFSHGPAHIMYKLRLLIKFAIIKHNVHITKLAGS